MTAKLFAHGEEKKPMKEKIEAIIIRLQGAIGADIVMQMHEGDASGTDYIAALTTRENCLDDAEVLLKEMKS